MSCYMQRMSIYWVKWDTFSTIKNLQLMMFRPLVLLGHLSNSVDLLLWVGVRRRPSSFVRRPLKSSSQELLGQS